MFTLAVGWTLGFSYQRDLPRGDPIVEGTKAATENKQCQEAFLLKGL